MASLFRPALELLTQYATYHRDRRNIATHLVGVPMIVFAVALLLARGGLVLGAWSLSWATTNVAFAVRRQPMRVVRA